MESAATAQYQRWLVADPLDRLGLDPADVVAHFDVFKYQRVESRAVSLVLAAVPSHVRDEAVSNRWLSTAALIFRIQCLYQPGGSSERAMLLHQLVNPEVAKSVGAAVTMLRRWMQHLQRVRELGASLPDPSLLLRGIDQATSGLLAQYPAVGFRVNAFRHRVALGYNPSVSSVVSLVRLVQAECEAASISGDSQGSPDKRARNAATRTEPETQPSKPTSPDRPPNINAAATDAAAKALEGLGGDKGEGKGKGKGKEPGNNPSPCHNFVEGKGCRFGDSCRFKHDRTAARKQKRCLACGQEGHFRPECPLVSPENRQVVNPSEANSPTSPKTAPKKPGVAPKPKVIPQASGRRCGGRERVRKHCHFGSGRCC